MKMPGTLDGSEHCSAHLFARATTVRRFVTYARRALCWTYTGMRAAASRVLHPPSYHNWITFPLCPTTHYSMPTTAAVARITTPAAAPLPTYALVCAVHNAYRHACAVGPPPLLPNTWFRRRASRLAARRAALLLLPPTACHRTLDTLPSLLRFPFAFTALPHISWRHPVPLPIRTAPVLIHRCFH